MTLDQLRVFVAVAEREHVTRAADALHLTQSAVSATIHALEQRHGIKLFHRIGRSIELTQAGRVLLGEARAILARTAAAESALSELGGLQRGALTLRASHTVADYWLPRHLVGFRALYPRVTVLLATGNTAQVAHAVREGEAEVGFVEETLEGAELSATVVGNDRMIVVAAPSHPWATLGAVEPGTLPQSPWILREPGSGTRAAFDAALEGLGVDLACLTIALELPSNEAVRTAVEAGGGVGCMSAAVAQAGLQGGTLARVAFELPAQPIHAFLHRDRYRSKAAGALLDLIRREKDALDRHHGPSLPIRKAD